VGFGSPLIFVTVFNIICYFFCLVILSVLRYNKIDITQGKEGEILNLCIADNLKILRYKYGYTLENIAEIISVSRQTVSKWEAGDTIPDIMSCTKLAHLYKITLDELVYKPLKAVIMNDFEEENGCICGVVELTDGAMRIPDPVLELFGIDKNDKLLVLADKSKGIALMKCSKF